MKLIPLSMFAGVCEEQRIIIENTWPNGIPVTAESAQTAVNLGLCLHTAAALLLNKFDLDKFSKVVNPLWRDYSKNTDPALLSYRKSIVKLVNKIFYKKVGGPLWEEYDVKTWEENYVKELISINNDYHNAIEDYMKAVSLILLDFLKQI